MTTKTRITSQSAGQRPALQLPPWPGSTPPWTTEQRLQHIEAMGQRIQGYVAFIGKVGSLAGASGDAKERAVAAFYVQLAALEKRLARIQEDLQLA
jgi:hypothetical protein